MKSDSLTTLAAFSPVHVWLPRLPSFLYSKQEQLKWKGAKFESKQLPWKSWSPISVGCAKYWAQV